MSVQETLDMMKALFSQIVTMMQSFHVFGTDLFTLSLAFMAVGILIMFIKFALYQSHGDGK